MGAHILSIIVVNVAAIERDCSIADVKTSALTYTYTAVLQARPLPGSFFQLPGKGRAGARIAASLTYCNVPSGCDGKR